MAGAAAGGSGTGDGSSRRFQVSLSRVDLQIFFFNWDMYSCWNLIVVVVNRIIGNVSCLN